VKKRKETETGEKEKKKKNEMIILTKKLAELKEIDDILRVKEQRKRKWEMKMEEIDSNSYLLLLL
jgi:hypothetical protein